MARKGAGNLADGVANKSLSVIRHKKRLSPGGQSHREPLAYNGDAPESKSGRFFGMVNVLESRSC